MLSIRGEKHSDTITRRLVEVPWRYQHSTGQITPFRVKLHTGNVTARVNIIYH